MSASCPSAVLGSDLGQYCHPETLSLVISYCPQVSLVPPATPERRQGGRGQECSNQVPSFLAASPWLPALPGGGGEAATFAIPGTLHLSLSGPERPATLCSLLVRHGPGPEASCHPAKAPSDTQTCHPFSQPNEDEQTQRRFGPEPPRSPWPCKESGPPGGKRDRQATARKSACHGAETEGPRVCRRPAGFFRPSSTSFDPGASWEK